MRKNYLDVFCVLILILFIWYSIFKLQKVSIFIFELDALRIKFQSRYAFISIYVFYLKNQKDEE